MNKKIPGNKYYHRLFLLLVLASWWFTSFAAAVEPPPKSQHELPQVSIPDKIKALFEAKRWQEAADALVKIYNSENADANLKYYLAYCYEQLAAEAFKKGEYREAVGKLEKAVNYVDEDPEFHAALGICHFELCQYPEAIGAFKEALKLNPTHLLAHKKLGEIYYLTNELEQAAYHWEEALALDPMDMSLRKRLQGLKKLDKASTYFEQEIDTFFEVTFDGEQNLKLKGNVMESLEDIYTEIGQELNLFPIRQIKVVLLSNQEFFDITGSPKWAGGVYEGQIKIPVGNCNMKRLKVVLRHEYIHAVINDRLAQRCPWWLNEGLAQYYSLDEEEKSQRLQISTMLKAHAQGRLPDLMSLPGVWFRSVNGVRIAYVLALSGINFFIEEFSSLDLQDIIDLMAEGKNFKAALEEITPYTYDEFEEKWKNFKR